MEISWITVEGHRVARMLGPTVTASVDVDRGAHIFELVDLGSGTNVLYRDPRGLVDHVVGGWYSLFPNAGPACVVGSCGFRGFRPPGFAANGHPVSPETATLVHG